MMLCVCDECILVELHTCGRSSFCAHSQLLLTVVYNRFLSGSKCD